MRSLERHRDVGAYALGVLDEAEAFRFEDHLMECPSCAAQVTEFGVTTRQLMLYRRSTPPLTHPMPKPGPRMLDRLLSEAANRNRAVRRRLLFALAASVVLAVTAPALALMSSDGGERAPESIAAADERSGVWAEITTADEAWGSRLELKVKDGAGPRVCRLVVVGQDGSEETVTSWHVPRHDARPNTMTSGSTLHSGQVERYELRSSDGEHLVTLKPR
ncbi:zf-HC2 domain-containing protein [Streptomyces hirsutus]|uniref:Zf-HC2 domain-containing protein n=1 Tax=Streptomyces hirsutus TaxID=35620 RepID=A0ABZ1GZJ9_9ACTN|nr:zf-HC2 domain-containing protein [Streptomyces hirsutus]WSD10585.1 zf-HC2 domain-containing protein [Streptomyces hirsutus]WTD16068.1 zf-HC2 domain-containing protein [Streptomyces hirsutus]WTD73411.1 zf-HC2 domain-containing protein [Streptomyces sp. NBC_01635]